MTVRLKKRNQSQPKTLWDLLTSLDDHTLLFPGWTARDVSRKVLEQKEQLIRKGLKKGEIAGFRIKNNAEHVIAMLCLIYAGARPLLISHDAPELEAKRLCKSLSTCRTIEIGNIKEDEWIILKGEAAVADQKLSGIILTTSGSTGLPKMVVCSEENLLLEGYRYAKMFQVHEEDTVILPLPLSHAYGMGWLLGCLTGGACLQLLSPTALGAIEKALVRYATIAALTPTLARLISLRQITDKNEEQNKKLRFVMVGAGPVDNFLEKKFRQKFGILLSRNYGSTETGTTFAGFPPLPPKCVGTPLPGVQFKILHPNDLRCETGEIGTLYVTDLSGNWFNTGDLAYQDVHGRVLIIGRKNKSIRKGDRWISPSEIESVLFGYPHIKDAHVFFAKGIRADTRQIIADVVPKDKKTYCRTDLMDYMKKNLASYKIPDVIKEHDSLFRTQSGKIKEKPRYVSGEPTFLISAARAYKRSELLFTLFETGILSHLDGKTDIHTLAEKLNFDQNVLEKLMRLAESLRLVSQVKKNERFSLDPTPYIELESYLSRTFSVREEMADILKKGFHKRRFSTQTVSEEFVQKYNQAMHGPHISYKTIFGLHALRPKKGCRILEITTGPGRYLETFLERDKTAQGFLLQQGILSGEISSILKQAVTDKRLFIETKFENSMIDICIVNNSIHNFTSIESIQWVLKRLSSEGSILVDDIFLPVEGSDAEIGVDWFTHGGMAFQTFSELEQTIIRLGHTIRSLDAMGHPLQKLILIKKGK